MEHAPSIVTRTLVLPVSTDEAWTSLRDADGLAGWLGDAVDLEVVPGAAGTIVEGGTVRRVVVTEVEAGRSIGFAWWDEDAPAAASVVTISLDPQASGDGTTVTVTERLAGAAPALVGSASVDDLLAVGSGWDRRLQAMLGAPVRTPALV